MSSPGGILGAGTLVARNVAGTTLYLDDASAPVLNIAHQYASGTINFSAGTNPAASFSVTPVAVSNSQLFSGPNVLVSNTLSVPGQINIGTANVANALNCFGPSTLVGQTAITGNLSVFGTANVVNSLSVGNTVTVPTLRANAISALGPMANCYLETSTALSSQSSALYLSPAWRVKVVSSGGLAFQSLLNGQWVNSSVIAPSGVAITISNLTTPVT